MVGEYNMKEFDISLMMTANEANKQSLKNREYLQADFIADMQNQIADEIRYSVNNGTFHTVIQFPSRWDLFDDNCYIDEILKPFKEILNYETEIEEEVNNIYLTIRWGC